MTANVYEISFWGDKNILELVVMTVQPYEYTEDHWIVLFRMVYLEAFERLLPSICGQSDSNKLLRKKEKKMWCILWHVN